MTERAAHLVDDVIPFVPVRQWVLIQAVMNVGLSGHTRNFARSPDLTPDGGKLMSDPPPAIW